MAEKKESTQEELRESMHKIWLAGLGALAAAEEEGEKLFKRLVDRGEKMESEGRKGVKEARGRVESAWSDLEGKLDETVAGVLNRLGVPTREEIQTLTQRIEELNAKVQELSTKKAGRGS